MMLLTWELILEVTQHERWIYINVWNLAIVIRMNVFVTVFFCIDVARFLCEHQ